MLRLVVQTAQAAILALIAYNAVTALWGWRNREPAPEGSRTRRLRIVIPAHNEAKVIDGILSDLSGSEYSNRDICVIADRCTDDTAEVALRAGVHVAERDSGPGGKGAALSWYLAKHPLQNGEALIVFDADNRLPPEILSRISDELDEGHEVLQCYLDVANPDSSLLSEASALSYWAGNRMVQLARSNLGWSADLGGTGMALSKDALSAAGGFSDSLTEDQELAAKLLLSGKRVEWLHDVRVRDEKPVSVGVTVRQRARWMAGKRAARQKYFLPLLKTGRAAEIDQAFRLAQPSRSFIALVSGGLTLLSALGVSWLFPWSVWATVTFVQVLEPLPFLSRDGVAPSRLLRYPALALLAALWVPIRLVSTRVQGWYHTPHVVADDVKTSGRDRR